MKEKDLLRGYLGTPCWEGRSFKPCLFSIELKIIIESSAINGSNFDRGVLTQTHCSFKIVCFFTKSSAFFS